MNGFVFAGAPGAPLGGGHGVDVAALRAQRGVLLRPQSHPHGRLVALRLSGTHAHAHRCLRLRNGEFPLGIRHSTVHSPHAHNRLHFVNTAGVGVAPSTPTANPESIKHSLLPIYSLHVNYIWSMDIP